MMRRICSLLLCLLLPVVMTACTASADTRSGEAQGYGGMLRVTVSMTGDDITAVKITEHHETEGVGTRAIEVLPDMIVRTDSADVDSVSGATVTSNAIKEAVRQAMGVTSLPDLTAPVKDMMGMGDGSLEGVGMAATGRVGPGTDKDGSQVYSFNVVFASGRFDADGTIRNLDVEQLEVLSSQFSGFPGDGEDTEAFMNEVSGWIPKGAKGEDYNLNSGTWRQQMDAYEKLMTGMSVDEVKSWYNTHFSADTGRPLTEGEAYDTLAEPEKQMIADITSGATMSLRGEYGDILLAIERAWEDAQRRSGNAQGTESTATPTDGSMVDTNTLTDSTESEPAMG